MTHPMKQKASWWPFAVGGGPTLGLFFAFWLAALLLLLIFPNVWTILIFIIDTVLLGFMMWFFRDPNRPLPRDPMLIVGPGDGEVVEIVEEFEPLYLQREVTRISMFLSVTNVHVQRNPVKGRVLEVRHVTGKFLQAFKPEASEVNENIGMHVRTPYGDVLVKQIAGILARRCVNHQQDGDEVTLGERFGLIKFGSRVDLFLPLDAKIKVQVGDTVVGGVTEMGRFEIKIADK